jgi:alpha-N-arabinofuranosidase
MNCYAPLFTRVNPGGSQWSTDLIGYNTLTSFGSPSYYVQKMFFNAKGDQVIPIAKIVPQTIPIQEPMPEPTPAPAGRFGFVRKESPPSPEEPLFACASKEDASGDIILKVVNVFNVDQTMNVELSGANVQKVSTGEVMVGMPDDINSVDAPYHTASKRFIVTNASSNWTHTFPGNSITVVRFKTVN